MRGLAIGVPVALLFAVLFASADPIFRRGMDDLLGFQLDLGDVPGRVVFALACAWLAIGLLSVAAGGLPAAAAASLGAAAGWQTAGDRRMRLGGPEALIVLGLVDLVSGTFVALQIAYLFGGIDTLAAAGMTYSDYARRGFFELVAAACLAGGLLVALEIAIVARTRAYLAAALVLVVLTVVVLASAWLRLDLYQLAYGWTELRFYVAAAIVALAIALGLGAGLMVLDRVRWLGHGLVAVGLVSLLGLNAIAPAAFVADRNVQRVVHPELVPADGWVGLDTGYLGALGDDAIPVLVEAVTLLPEPYRGEVLGQLRGRALELSEPAWTSPAAWNAARDRARAALADLP
jgi:signal transduction histidine kinase